jgi:hypothetical protein
LLHYLAVAATLQHAYDPARIAGLRNVLSSGSDSPLYTPGIHASEPKATLLRAGL